MIYEAMSQPLVFIVIAIAGFLCGFLFDLSTFFSYLCEKNKLLSQIFSFLATLASFIVFAAVNLACNYGRVRFFPILVFFYMLLLQRFIIGSFFAKISNKCYNKLTKFFERKKNERRRKKEKKAENNNI